MIPRYTHPEMGAVWSEARRYGAWLEVELAATDALAEAGVVPEADARTLRERASFDVARIEEIEQTTQHDVIAFTTAVAERVGPAARWLHYGLTSSDVIDTAQALQMREACDLVICGHRRPARRGGAAGRGTPADADDWAHAWRPRRADDLRREAGALVRGDSARPATDCAGARDGVGRQAVRRGRHVRAPGPVGRGVGVQAPWPHACAGVLTDRAARPARGAHDLARDPRRRRSRNSRSRSAACRKPRLARSRSRLPAARRAPRRCRTSATRSGASRSPVSRGSFAATPSPRSRTWRSGTNATSRTPRSNGSSCPTVSSRSITCCAGSRASSRAWSCIRSGCSKISAVPGASCFPARFCSSSRRTACRVSRPTSGCSATRCARFTSSGISRICSSPIPTWPAACRAR